MGHLCHNLNKDLRYEKICTIKWKHVGNLHHGLVLLTIHWYEVPDSSAKIEPSLVIDHNYQLVIYKEPVELVNYHSKNDSM